MLMRRIIWLFLSIILLLLYLTVRDIRSSILLLQAALTCRLISAMSDLWNIRILLYLPLIMFYDSLIILTWWKLSPTIPFKGSFMINFSICTVSIWCCYTNLQAVPLCKSITIMGRIFAMPFFNPMDRSLVSTVRQIIPLTHKGSVRKTDFLYLNQCRLHHR